MGNCIKFLTKKNNIVIIRFFILFLHNQKIFDEQKC